MVVVFLTMSLFFVVCAWRVYLSAVLYFPYLRFCVRGASVGLRFFFALFLLVFSRALLAGLRLFTAFLIYCFFFARGALIGLRMYAIVLISCFLCVVF